MTAMNQTSSKFPLAAVLITAVVLTVVVVSPIIAGWNTSHISRVRSVPRLSKSIEVPYASVTDHCLESHPGECLKIKDWVNENGKYCGAGCPDGRERYMCRVSKNLWYVLVGVGTEVITAYGTDYQPINVQEGCDQIWHVSGHP